MAYFLFIDESGQDGRNSPYEVLAGVAVEDRELWNLIRAIQDAEYACFGMRYSRGDAELKGKTLLKTKTFRLAAQMPPIPETERTDLARQCLEDGAKANRRQLTALAQAKLAYVGEVFDICARFRCVVFASIVTQKAPKPMGSEFLRKDYAYLFERFFYFLEDRNATVSGIVVFDELEKSQSHILVSQMDRYFKETSKGRQRAGLIIPEPFFVHSDLTTGIQIADLAAYLISWGLRIPGMTQPGRGELDDLVEKVRSLGYHTRRTIDGKPDFAVYGFSVITDLRPRGLQNS